MKNTIINPSKVPIKTAQYGANYRRKSLKIHISARILVFLIFLFSAFSLSLAQDTIIDNLKFNYVTLYENGQIKELGNFRVEGERKYKEGYWIKYDSTGTLIEKGHYSKNEKIKVWTECHNSKRFCWIGPYSNGRRDGEWFDGGDKFTTYENGRKTKVFLVEWKTNRERNKRGKRTQFSVFTPRTNSF